MNHKKVENETSVIVLNWNGKYLLKECFDSLANQSYKNFETIMVDNGSQDGSIQFVKQNYPWVKILELDKNYGFGAGNNRGIQIAKGKYIAFLNNDTKVDKNWLHELVTILENNNTIGFCSSKILIYGKDSVLDNVGIGFLKSGVGYKIGWLEKDVGQYDNLGFVFGACCGAALFRKSVLDDIGIFDELINTYNDDIDLSFRAQLNGYPCYFASRAKVFHKVSATAGFKSELQTYLSQRNVEIVWLKNMPVKLLFAYLILHVIHSLVSLLKCIIGGHGKVAILGKMYFLKHLLSILKKRKIIQTNRKVDDRYIHSFFTWSKKIPKHKLSTNNQWEIIEINNYI